jgi:ribosomal protein L6P/L9E
MSRIGKLPVKIPEKVKVAVTGTIVKIEGPKGKMSLAFNPAPGCASAAPTRAASPRACTA